jgi:Domain of unknown function (DUF4349)/Putative zinc-finger
MSTSNHPVEQEELMSYLDGELSAENAANTASHLENCPECRNLAADLQEVSHMLMTWQVEAAESERAEDMAEALEKRVSPRTDSLAHSSWRNLLNPRRWPKPVWGLATVTSIVLAVLMSVPTFLRQEHMSAPIVQTATPSAGKPEPLIESKDGAISGYMDRIRPRGSITTRSRLSRAPSPTATPRPDGSGEGTLGKLQQDAEETRSPSLNNGPMIIRTAELSLTTKEFDKARSSVEEILKRRHGYVGELNVSTPTGSARSLVGTLRVPAGQLDATLAELKGLGRVEKESQNGEEVTQQYVDLQARLANASHTEQRLTDILRQRTGKLSDVLAVEMQISRVRGEIEQMEAQRKSMKNQVDFATLTITVSEEYKAELKAIPPSTSTQFRNAAVEGYRSLVDGIIAVLLWLLSAGPALLLWGAIMFFPARMVWKRLRPRFRQKTSAT